MQYDFRKGIVKQRFFEERKMESKLIFQQYNEALKENRIMGLRCSNCRETIFPAKILCPQCGSNNLDPIQLKNSGIVCTFTTNYIPAESREAEVPYVIVIVELDDGPWIMGNLTGIAPDQVTMKVIGQRVSMVGARVFPGDKYSNGELARPLFQLL